MTARLGNTYGGAGSFAADTSNVAGCLWDEVEESWRLEKEKGEWLHWLIPCCTLLCKRCTSLSARCSTF